MPITKSTDYNGSYYRYGSKGIKYYYTPGNTFERNIAKSLAKKRW